MTALAYIAFGVLLAIVLAVLHRKDTADVSATFGSVGAAQSYALQQEVAGYDCFLSTRRDGTWEVRCYLRKEHAL